jgi:GT2 family glycosyltransferase
VHALTVVIVHWDQPERCATTLDAFRASTVPVDFIIADSASEPMAIAAVRRLAEASDVTLVEARENRGFGPTANLGLSHWLRHGVAPWVALAPHDAVPDPSTLESLLAAAQHRPRAGLVSADVGDGASPVIDRYFGGILRPAATTGGWEPVDHPHGTLMLLARSLLVEVGLFDERYSSYCEEADLALRAAAGGYEIGLVRGATVRNPHLGGRVPTVDYLQVRNTLLLVREHFGWYPATIRLLMVVGQTLLGLVSPDRRPPVFDPGARVRAVRDHLADTAHPRPRSSAGERRFGGRAAMLEDLRAVPFPMTTQSDMLTALRSMCSSPTPSPVRP